MCALTACTMCMCIKKWREDGSLEPKHVANYVLMTTIYVVYLNINPLDALNFIMSLFHASTCFEHTCSSSGGQNCTVQSLVSSH